jgi:hypothetical protein
VQLKAGLITPLYLREEEQDMRRRMAMLIVMVLALLALGAAAALAQNQIIHCLKLPCYGTGSDDLVYERVGNGKPDKILLRGGDDQVRANRYHRDHDVIKGSLGFDLIYVNDGDRRDKIYGGKGDDKCYVDARSEVGGGCSRVIVVR